MTTKQYLAYQSFGSIFVNGAIAVGSAWSKRHEAEISVWSYPGVASDTLISGCLLSVLTILIGSLFVRIDVRLGRVTPLAGSRPWASAPFNVWKRAAIFGPLFAIPSVLLALSVLRIAAPAELSFTAFLSFKVGFSALLGMLVTPFNAQAVLASIARSHVTLPS